MPSLLKRNFQNTEKNELEGILKILEQADSSEGYRQFYRAFKQTSLPFIPCYEKNPKKIYQSCFNVLHEIGKISIPVSVALSMHYYVLASMATYPFSKKSKEYWKREMLLQKIKKEKLLIANTGSVRTFKSAAGDRAILAKKEQDQYVINGQAPFMSLSGIADYMVFTAPLKEKDFDHKAIFFIPVSTENIEFEDEVFGEVMQGSFTRSVAFNKVEISTGNVIKLDNDEDERCEILVYQRSWFQGLVPAAYLGASNRILDELKSFSLKKIKNGKRLSESDNFTERFGELIIAYRTAMQLCNYAAQKFEDFRKGDDHLVEELFESTVLAKFQSTHIAEEIVAQSRHIMGTSFLKQNSITDKISKEIVFGVLQPMADIDTKKHFSDRY